MENAYEIISYFYHTGLVRPNRGLIVQDPNKIPLDHLEGKTILDIGCGPDATAVRFLRDKHIKADGIDPEIIDPSDFLFKQGIVSKKPFEGHIPIGDQSYDYVTTHYFDPFLQFVTANHESLNKSSYLRNQVKNEAEMAESVLSEAVRVLKPDGKILCFPCLVLFDQSSFSDIALSIKSHKLEEVVVEFSGLISELDFLTQCLYPEYETALTSRTEISR